MMSRTRSNLSLGSADFGAKLAKRRTRYRLSAFHSVVRHAGKLVQTENRLLAGKDPTVAKQPIGGMVKRTLDVVIALGALITLFPLFGLVACLVKASDGGPIFYRHMRLGHGRRTFPCLKFRTMVPNGDQVLAEHLRRSRTAAEEWATTRKLKSDPRITAVGATLRKLSIDELQPPAFHYGLGRLLRPLRDEGILLIGSGDVVMMMKTPSGVKKGVLTNVWHIPKLTRNLFSVGRFTRQPSSFSPDFSEMQSSPVASSQSSTMTLRQE